MILRNIWESISSLSNHYSRNVHIRIKIDIYVGHYNYDNVCVISIMYKNVRPKKRLLNALVNCNS